MKKRILVLFLCMLFMAATAFAVVPRTQWNDDPDYYSDLEEDLYELDSSTLYDESEDLYDYSDSYSDGGSYDDDYNEEPSYDDDTSDEGEFSETPDAEPDDDSAVPQNDQPDEEPDEEPADNNNVPEKEPVTDEEQDEEPDPQTTANDDNQITPEGSDNQPDETPAENPDHPPVAPEQADPQAVPTEAPDNGQESTTYGPDYYDDQIDYDALRRQYEEIQPDDDPNVILYPEEIIRYIVIEDPIVYIDETIELVPIEYPEELAIQIETTSRNYPYRARVATHGGRLNVRSGPGTDYHVLGLIPNGSLVIVYGRSLDLKWAYVVCENGLQGFVLDAYLTTRNIFAKPTPAPAAAPALSVIGHVEFETTALDGTNYRSTDIFDYNFVTMINVWSTESIASVKEMEALQSISSQLSETNIAVVGICENATDAAHIEKANQILKEKGVTFTNLVPPANMEQIFPVRGYPTTYFVDYNGDVWGAPIEGAYPDAFVDRLIEIFNIVR